MDDPIKALQYLKSRGWSQSEIAAHAGTTQATISRIKRKNVSKVDYFIGGAIVQLATRERKRA